MIDTHQHFWRLSRGGYAWMPQDLPILCRDYEPTDLIDHLRAANIRGTIVVQADDNVAETEFLLSLSDETPWILGVVGWVDLESTTAPYEIDRLAKNPKFLGVRPMIQDIEEDDWMLKPALTAALHTLQKRDLTFDALVLQRHLPNLNTFLSTYPDLRVVIDHCAKPVFEEATFEVWASGMNKSAAHQNCFCKLSGLMTEAPLGTEIEVIYRYLDHVIDAFGEDRVIFGSDWPVLNLTSDYATWVEIVRTCLGRRTDADVEKMLVDNAVRAYPRTAQFNGVRI